MMILIAGANSSGKSAFAEDLAVRIADGPLYYIATMVPHGPEGAARVARHLTRRAGRGFITIESPGAVLPARDADTVLLEDVSNLLADAMFATNPAAVPLAGITPATQAAVPITVTKTTVLTAESAVPLTTTATPPERETAPADTHAVAVVVNQILTLRAASRHLLAVTITGLTSDGITDPGTLTYIATLAAVNDRLRSEADTVVDLTAGTPLITKGRLP
jgi:adenosylcobinamide kinase/adenosylcobinamide-phosphate guanylyltransferase